jgi:hypothetical protein
MSHIVVPREIRNGLCVAFRETVQFVTAELKAAGEQWSDQAKQDMVSTVLIAASKSGLVGVWER